MPEVKNNFLKSKMNKDLDARILPSGEYRDAQNVNVSKSEGEDVGSLENVLGNVLLSDFGLTDECGLEIIGKYMDIDNNRVFAMLTNYADTSPDKLSNSTLKVASASTSAHIKCYIGVYNLNSNTSSVIVDGIFLNFSKTHQIYGIDLIEDHLFWTDNRNQPRKINVTTAIANPSYYFAEEHISVARYAPFLPIQFTTGTASTMLDTVRENLPDGTTPNPHKVVGWDGDEDFLEDRFVRFSYRLKYDDNEYSLIAPFSQIAFIPQEDGYFIRRDEDSDVTTIEKDNISSTYRSTEVSFMRNKVTQIGIKIPEITNGIDPINTLGLRGWANVIDDFKVKEIEILYKESNSNAVKVVAVIDAVDLTKSPTKLIDPFGYLSYIYKSSKPIKTLPNSQIIRASDKTPVKALAQSISGNRVIYGNYQDKHSYPSSLNYTVSVVDKTNTDAIEYPNHTLKQNRSYDVGIVLSDIYGRQSGVITSKTDGFSTIFNNFKESGFSNALGGVGDIGTWVGDVLSMDFFEKIPESSNLSNYPGIHRFDNPLGWFSYKVVVKQKEQEYYNVYLPGILNGYVFDAGGGSALVEPATAINPTCHVVIHGDNINKIPRDLMEVGPEQKLFRSGARKPKPSQDEFVAQVLNLSTQIATLQASDIGTNQEAASQTLSRLTNIKNNRAEELETLARQNVTRETLENSSVTLYGRVTNYNYTSAQAGLGIAGLRNSKQFYPFSTNGTKKDDVVTIAKLTDLGLTAGTLTGWALDGDTTDPLIAKLLVEDITIGATATNGAGNMLPTISVYETEPFESQIDIYWETTTSGLVEELNTDIEINTTEIVNLFRRNITPYSSTWKNDLFKDDINEGVNPISSPEIIIKNDNVIGAYNDVNISTTPSPDISTYSPGSMSLVEVRDGAGNLVTNKFDLVVGDSGTTPNFRYYQIKLIDYLTFNANLSENEFYFTIEVIEEISQIASSKIIGPFKLLNSKPEWDLSFPTLGTGSINGGTIAFNATPKATNGSADPVNNTNQLSFLINSQTDNLGNPVNYFSTTPSGIDGQVALSNSVTPSGSYKVSFKVIDAGNASATSSTVTVNIS